jgi:CheY-like chemotaxis protein
MTRRAAPSPVLETGEPDELGTTTLACLAADGRVLSRQHVSGDRRTALDGARSGDPPNEDQGRGTGGSRDGSRDQSAQDDGGRRRALIADEDPMMRWLLQRALASDFDVIVAENGQRAVELAARSCPDVIVLDLGMPVLDGFGACRLIRAAYPRVPIVIVSGHNDEGSVLAAFEAGATDYLTKPFTASQLRARLQACLLRAR